ncbi:hypothetical protein [Aeromonas sp. 604176]|uniref:hypothetical protein n=1 Tax=Aeromonas sp. 604176 TaxID=2712052 RepID=UPI003B9DD816
MPAIQYFNFFCCRCGEPNATSYCATLPLCHSATLPLCHSDPSSSCSSEIARLHSCPS